MKNCACVMLFTLGIAILQLPALHAVKNISLQNLSVEMAAHAFAGNRTAPYNVQLIQPYTFPVFLSLWSLSEKFGPLHVLGLPPEEFDVSNSLRKGQYVFTMVSQAWCFRTQNVGFAMIDYKPIYYMCKSVLGLLRGLVTIIIIILFTPIYLSIGDGH